MFKIEDFIYGATCAWTFIEEDSNSFNIFVK